VYFILRAESEGEVVFKTQKPQSLSEYVIKTYTMESQTVLDFTMGSGSSGVAAKNLNRNYIGIEYDYDTYCIALNRLNIEHEG